MDRNGDSEKDEEETEGPMFCDEDRAVEEGEPEGRYGNRLHAHGDGLMYHEVRYVRTHLRMVHEPVVQALVAPQEEGRGQQKQGSGRKHGDECSENSQAEGQTSQYGE